MNPPIRWSWHTLDAFAPLDLFDYLRLRTDAFVVEQNCAYPELDDHDRDALHLTGHIDGRLIGALRLIGPGRVHDDPALGRVVVAPAARGTGAGHLLVAEGLRTAAELYPGRGNEIAAQAHLQGFYGRHGFVAVGEEFLEDGIPHVMMRVSADRMP
ncbi:MAG TPA: GNAT family N-acetyltransferase [Gryllotalpicola sp.]